MTQVQRKVGPGRYVTVKQKPTKKIPQKSENLESTIEVPSEVENFKPLEEMTLSEVKEFALSKGIKVGNRGLKKAILFVEEQLADDEL